MAENEKTERIIYAVDDVSDIARRLAELETTSRMTQKWAVWYERNNCWTWFDGNGFRVTNDPDRVSIYDSEPDAQDLINRHLNSKGASQLTVKRWPPEL